MSTWITGSRRNSPPSCRSWKPIRNGPRATMPGTYEASQRSPSRKRFSSRAKPSSAIQAYSPVLASLRKKIGYSRRIVRELGGKRGYRSDCFAKIFAMARQRRAGSCVRHCSAGRVGPLDPRIETLKRRRPLMISGLLHFNNTLLRVQIRTCNGHPARSVHPGLPGATTACSNDRASARPHP